MGLGRAVGLAVMLAVGLQGVAQVNGPAASGTAQGQQTSTSGGGAGQGRPAMAAVGVPVLGMPFVHDPSTVVKFHGKYYVYSTGRGIPFYSSPDGETWTREGSVFEKIPDGVHAVVPKNDGTGVWAPDITRVGNEFYLYYAVSSWGSFQSAIGLATNPVLDPKDPTYKWTDRGVVVTSNGTEDLNAIDPGVMLAPDGTLWLCYGSYHGSIRVTELNPKTGLALEPGKLGAAVATADRSEASDLIFHDGYFYLFVNHDSCCKGKNSEYNIRVGRSKAVTGPYLDKHGEAMTKGGGSLFLAAHDHRIGPGHFGLMTDYDSAPEGAERFSVHYEADLTRGGRSVLDMRPLLWSKDGWPVASDNLNDGTYEIASRQSEYTLQATGAGLRVGRYLTLDNQKWTIAAAGGGFSKIVNAGTGEALGVVGGTATLAAYTGADGQLWRLEEFPDGGYRIWNKGTGTSLTAAGRDGTTVEKFSRDDMHLWVITTP